MKKIKYYYNTHSLRYEKFIVPLRVKLLRALGILSAFVVTALLVIWLYSKFIPKPTDIEARRKVELMRENYKTLSAKVKALEDQMNALEHRDNEVYRSIFEANPVADSMRAKLMEKKKDIEKISVLDDGDIGKDIAAQLNNISARAAYQLKSYTDIENLIKNQEAKLACIPAIQPVSNKQLDRIASGFGYRIHPIYGIAKMHNGLDFTAPQGTPIYATGDGQIAEAGTSSSMGNYVKINHGYGYETVYMHMVRLNVSGGQAVKRGQTIGWVGSTGASTGPHCHYEVHVNGTPVDPVYFFYNDLTPDQYDLVLKHAATGSAKSFD